MLLVVVKSDHTLAVVDPASLKIISRVPVAEDPHEVVASADGTLAYVSNSGGGSDNRISVVDLINRKALPPVVLGPLRGPHGLAFAGGKVWFTAETAKAIGRYDPVASQVDWVLGTGQDRTHMISVSSDLQHIVTANVTSATMTIIERRTAASRGRGRTVDWTETVVPVGKGAEGFDVSPEGKEIWVANAQEGTISIISMARKQVIETISANVPESNRVKFTPDGKLVFVSMLRSSDVVIFDAATRKELKRLALAHGATAIEMQPDGSRAYISSTPDDFVAVIDLKSMSVVGRVVTGKQPDGLAWAVRP